MTDDPAPPAPRSRLARLICITLLVASSSITFWPAVSHQFLDWDEQGPVVLNPDFHGFTAANLARYWTTLSAGLYVPVTYTTWGVVSRIAQRDQPDARGGYLDPRPFHVLNFALHVINGVLVFFLPRRFTSGDLSAWIGAMLFALHPLVTEPLSWVSSMYTLLSTTFGLLALWQYACYAKLARDDASANRRRWLYAGATVAFVLAMLTKPFGVVLPVMAGLLDWLLIARPMRRVALALLPWVVLALPIVLANKAAQPAIQVYRPTPPQRLLVAADTTAFYLKKLVLPVRLIPDYGRTPQWVLARRERFAVALVPLIVAALCWWQRKRRPWLLASFGLFVVAAAPALGLVPFDFQLYSTAADRYAYFSLLGAALLVACGLDRLRAPRVRFSAIVMSILCLATLGVLSHRQVRRWHDSQSLFAYTIAINPQSLAANRVFGFLAMNAGRESEALRYYETALRTYPKDPLILYNLGNFRLRAGDPQGAAEYYRLSIEANPTLMSPRVNLAALLASNGYYDEAIAQYEQVLQRQPAHELARAGLERARQLRSANPAAATRPAGG